MRAISAHMGAAPSGPVVWSGRSLRRGDELAQPTSEHRADLGVVDPQLGQRVLERAHDELDLERGFDLRRRIQAEHPGTAVPNRKYPIDCPQLGILREPWQPAVLMLAVVLLVVQGFAINRLAGIPCPVWSPRPTEPETRPSR